ncbi:MaoC family dehydratase [Microbacterium caowuchunii]|uniref:MaoC family dehydratase n=1 Tax=Microbacterium caowuchunii TaxID=2614638 RepID=UPI001247B4FE|nr:MaoC family dehydratase [Microbacterium caowuchunii]QEW01213.1 MaoC family dehydratase [Microbacterium caowuchunii]
MTIAVGSVAALTDAVGESAVSDWFEITQERIQAFADATEDHQWIHVDPARAAVGPFGAPIAHGYLTLSLLPRLTAGLLEVGGVGLVVNYGLDRVRFLQPVPAGSAVRASTRIDTVEPSGAGMRVGMDTTVELRGQDRPALAARTVALFFPAQ